MNAMLITLLEIFFFTVLAGIGTLLGLTLFGWWSARSNEGGVK